MINIQSCNVHDARIAGYKNTKAQVLCFLDADDCLPPDYIECGLQKLRSNPLIGIVHSHLQCFGSSKKCIEFPDLVERHTLSAQNLIHAGSLVRRDAIKLSKAFETTLTADVSSVTGDWWIWKCVLESGWISVRQKTAYLYRRHSNSSLHTTKIGS